MKLRGCHKREPRGVVTRYSLLVLDFIALADKALFVVLSHVLIELVVAEEALAAELAHGVHASLNLLLRHRALVDLVIHGRQVEREDIGRVEDMFVREDLL